MTTVKGICQQNYIARWFTADNNELPQSSVKAIVQDKYNFIWMTTENGLVRYDGNNFLPFNASTTNLKHSRFTDIFGNIQKDSLSSFNESKKELVLIKKGKVQVLKKDQPVYKIIRNKKRFFFHDGLPSNYTINSFEPYYVRLANGNLFFIDTQKIELCDVKLRSIYKHAFKHNSVFNFFSLNNTLFYLYDNGNYDYFTKGRKSSGKLKLPVNKGKYKLYWNITTGQVFLLVQNKLYFLSGANNQLTAEPIVEFREFEKSNIISIYYDRKNLKLYLGSSTNGLCIISFPEFKTVKKDPEKNEVYYGATAFNDSTIVTTEGLILNNRKVIDSISFVKSDFLEEKLSIVKDDDNNIWLGRRRKVYCYLKKFGYKKYKTYHFSQNPKTLFKDHSNTIWISMGEDEFHKAKLYSIKNSIISLAAISNNNINFIAEYDQNTLYLGTEKGLLRFSKNTGKIYFVKKSEKINIRGIFVDSEKKVWLTTYEKGFFLYDNNHLNSFPADEDHYLNSSHCIIEDKKGFFWIPTNKGLFQVSRKVLLNYSKNKKGNIYYHQYNKQDGFLTNEFNGGCQPSGNLLKNNYIVFPSMNGFVFFNPYNVSTILPGKELFIDKVILDQKVLVPKDTIVLENNFQRVSFLLAYPYYGNPENMTIEAKMDKIGLDRWERIKDEKSISFTTLPPGEYNLTIRSLCGFDTNYIYKKVVLIVPAKFYQTIWFAIFCVILFILFIIFIWYVRLHYIKLKRKKLEYIIAKKTKKLATAIHKLEIAENDLKQEIKQHETLVKSMSHDIKSPLKFLSASINHLFINETIQDNIKLKQKVETIQASTQQLYEFVENLIKYSSIFMEGKKLEDKSYFLYDLIEQKIQIFEKIAEAENIQILNNINPNLDIRTNKKALSIIIHNLIDNAIKNTKNGTIELLCSTQKNILTLKIIDNGKGMSQELIDYYLDFYKKPIVKNYHLGLHMIIELLIIIKGNINIASAINEGTTIEIMVEYN